MKFENVILALIAAVLIIVVPITSPALSQNVGGLVEVPLGFVTELLGTIFEGLQQFQGDIWQFLLSAGISAPLTFGVVSLIKRFKPLAGVSEQVMATIVGFLLYGLMIAMQQAGQVATYETGVQVAVLILSLLAGTGAVQYGASSIHDRYVDTPLAFAWKRPKAS